jgi:dihydrofolate synthase/folylpolyglutamate synthase
LDYQQALDYIYSFANFETRPASRQMRADYTLDRIRALLAELGNPQDRYPTVHIAGTKGKGSTAAMLTSILTAAGYRTGLYTSPHLHTYRERIRVDSRLITEEEVARWVETHHGLLETFDKLTTFEVITAMAFDSFAHQQVDMAVIEVGLGGRLDTTNVITPVLSVITPISLDHTAVLGDTIAEIAHNKAGILKPGVPAVIAPQSDDAMSVIQDVAGEVGAPLSVAGRDWTCTPGAMHPDGQSFDVWGPAHKALRLWTPLLGAHEAVNATVAVAAAHELRRQSFSISMMAISSGLTTVEWPGRTELLSQRPWIMVDGAHNGASARCLLDTIDGLPGRRRMTLIFGASVDKRIDDLFEVLLPATNRLILTRASHPRAADPVLLQEIARRHRRSALLVPAVAEALMTAVADAGTDDLVLATGSLFVAAEARMAWFQHTGRPLPPHDPPKAALSRC